MNALVTGGTGFVGGSVVRQLLDRGHGVRVLARPRSRTEHLEKLGAGIVRGDILDRGSIVRALDGCDILFHAAAVYEFWITDKERLRTTEVEGTRNALDAALEAGVGQVVYTSTGACVGEPKGETGDETTPHRGYFLNFYEEAKYQAESLVKEYRDRLGIAIMRPAAVLGPGDLKPTGAGIVNLINGRFPAVFDGVLTFVDIDDAGLAHVLAAEKSRFGEIYILANETLPMREFFRMVCELSGARRPPTVPAFLASLSVHFYEWQARRTGQEPLISRNSFVFTTHGFRIDGSKARRELSLEYTPARESMRRAINWYWEQGLLRKRPNCVT